MGLDQYAYRRLPDEDGDGNITISQWRKHNRLHGWMEQLWEDRGRPYEGSLDDVEDHSFNCIELEITLDDLEQLEVDINNKLLPETGGFFFGNDSYENYQQYHEEKDLNFIMEAREAITNGQKVYYDSSW
tara:strand:- start:12963 stop:13352 length:390 start_codon:yes stop_codon:yes gene_type:complete